MFVCVCDREGESADIIGRNGEGNNRYNKRKIRKREEERMVSCGWREREIGKRAHYSAVFFSMLEVAVCVCERGQSTHYSSVFISLLEVVQCVCDCVFTVIESVWQTLWSVPPHRVLENWAGLSRVCEIGVRWSRRLCECVCVFTFI